MDENTIANYYGFEVKAIPNAHHRAYMAKIICSHPEYILDRQFLDLRRITKDDGWYYSADLEDFGVYEYSVKWFSDQKTDKDSDGYLYRYRGWFVQIDGFVHHYIKERKDVLPELRKLKRFLREIEGSDAA